MAAIGGFPGQTRQTEGRLRVGSPEYLAKWGHAPASLGKPKAEIVAERCEVEGCGRAAGHYTTPRFGTAA